MTVTVNGVRTVLADGARIDDVVRQVLGDERRHGVAVAVNGEVVPRSAWPATGLAVGDRVEVLSAAQGG